MEHVYKVETPKTCLKTQDLVQKRGNGLRKYVLDTSPMVANEYCEVSMLFSRQKVERLIKL